MKGTIVQLRGKGAEDIHLSTKPEITFFKAVYKKHTNFSMENIEAIFNTPPKFGSTCFVKLLREGDLISKVYLQLELPYEENSTAIWTNRIGFNIIKKVEVIIGNTIIERQYGLWMYLWSELTSTFDKHKMLNDMVGLTSKTGESSVGLPANQPNKLMIPLNFFFTKNYESALPVCALKDQEITFKFYFEQKSKCLQKGNISGDIVNASLWIDHIFIEKNEALNMVQNKLEYLIEVPQHHQKNISTQGENDIKIPFKLPCKELIWVLKNDNLTDVNDKFTDFSPKNNIIDIKANFYEHYNYGGWKTQLGEGEYTNTDLLSINSQFNSLSSIETNGFKIILYTGNNFDGNQLEITKNNSGLTIFNDKIRSLKIINVKKNNTLLNKIQFKIDSKKYFSTGSKLPNYFNRYLPYKYHNGNPNEGIYCYPFCLYPENQEPSGIINLENIKQFNLILNCNKSTLRLFSLSYNVLEIEDNMGTLKYKY